MANSFAVPPIWQMLDGNGNPYAGGLLYTWYAGTNTEKPVYDKDDVELPNPVVFDANGQATIKLAPGKYQMSFHDALDASVWTVDNIGEDIQTLQTVTNISALAAIPSASIVSGAAALVFGYNTNNDGGGGIFIWDSSSTATADNGIYVAPNDLGSSAGRWVRLIEGGINPRWFGAVLNGSTDDYAAFNAAIDYAIATSNYIELDYGSMYLSQNPNTTLSAPLIKFNDAVIQYTGFRPYINPLIPISDTSRHFNYSSGDIPHFPTDADIRYKWLDGITAGWYQHTFALQSDANLNTRDVLDLEAAESQIVILNDNGGTWVSGSISVTVNNVTSTQVSSGTKDTAMAALAVKIAADTVNVSSASYSATYHTLTITPTAGRTLNVSTDVTGIISGSLSFTIERRVTYNVSTSGRNINIIGQTVTAASTLNLGTHGTVFPISGTTQIDRISSVAWPFGSKIALLFDVDLPVITHNQAASGDSKPILLMDGYSYTPESGAYLELMYTTSGWLEIGRSRLRNPTLTSLVVSSNATVAGTLQCAGGAASLQIGTVGNQFHIREGTNGTGLACTTTSIMGSLTPGAGNSTVVMTNSLITVNSRIFLTCFDTASVCAAYVSAQSNGSASIRFTGSASTVIYYLIINPA